MNNFPRTILVKTLSFLARLAIKKHQMKLVIISGRVGSDVARELIYTVLKEKKNIRRNVSPIWWDLSIPLNVLGYEDKEYSLLGWLKIIFSAYVALLINQPNPQLLLLNVDSENKSTIKYWTDIINPKYLIILSYEENSDLLEGLIMRAIRNDGYIILPKAIRNDIELLKSSKGKNILDYGTQNSSLIIKNKDKEEIQIEYQKQTKVFSKKALPAHSNLIAGAMFLVAAQEGINIDDALFASLKYTFPSKLLSRVKANLTNKEFNV